MNTMLDWTKLWFDPSELQLIRYPPLQSSLWLTFGVVENNPTSASVQTQHENSFCWISRNIKSLILWRRGLGYCHAITRRLLRVLLEGETTSPQEQDGVSDKEHWHHKAKHLLEEKKEEYDI